MRPIKLYYQDCPACKYGKSWAEIVACAHEMKLSVEKVRYDEPGAREVIIAAHEAGFSVPFFYDGKKYGDSLMDFKSKDAKKAKEPADGSAEPLA